MDEATTGTRLYELKLSASHDGRLRWVDVHLCDRCADLARRFAVLRVTDSVTRGVVDSATALGAYVDALCDSCDGSITLHIPRVKSPSE